VDVDALPGAVTDDVPFDDVGDTSRWLLMNAPRPIYGDTVLTDGPFLTGRHWALIDLSDSLAQGAIASNRQNGAVAVLYADKATQTAMALNLASTDYLPAYLEMDAKELSESIGGLTAQLEGKTYGELKALAAKGMPVAPTPAVEPTPEPTPAADDGAAEEASRLEAERLAAEAAAAAEAEANAAAAAIVEAEEKARQEAAAAAAEEAARAEAAAAAAAEAQAAADAAALAFVQSAAAGNEDFYDKAVTDRLAELAKAAAPESEMAKVIAQAKTAAKNFFIAEFKRKVA
jgi:hypothetical protein